MAMPLNKSLWKIKSPLKLNIFIWFLLKGVILTKDNILKWIWSGDEKFCFCDNEEIIQHLFLVGHVSCFVWRIVPKVYEEKKKSHMPPAQ
jgi:hypothetical protein